jgi:hypothetical protein
VGLVGDLGQTFGQRMAEHFRQPFVAQLITEGLEVDEIEQTAAWARTVSTADSVIIFQC